MNTRPVPSVEVLGLDWLIDLLVESSLPTSPAPRNQALAQPQSDVSAAPSSSAANVPAANATAPVLVRHLHWLAENAAAIRSSNDHVERHGLPLARYRNF